LDATALGEPIYIKQGFQPVRTIVRWSGPAPVPANKLPPHRLGLHDGIFAIDAEGTGMDRSDLLRNMASSGTRFFSVEKAGRTTAYGALRPGRTASQLGPVLATSTAEFARVLDLAPAFGTGEEIVCDVPHPEAAGLLAAKGMLPRRNLKRMVMPFRPDCLCSGMVWCAAGFELG
jgi:hypothetical protein